MATKRPYPESHLSLKNRCPRVATLADGRCAVLSEPGFESQNEVRLHLCDASPAREGLPGPVRLVAPNDAVFECDDNAALSAGIWVDGNQRIWVAWSDGCTITVVRTTRAIDGDSPDRFEWEKFDAALPSSHAEGSHWFLGGGALSGNNSASLFLSAIETPAGRVVLFEVGEGGCTHAILHLHVQNHSPNLAIGPNSKTIHLVWDTEDLKIQYLRVDVDAFRAGTTCCEEPSDVFWHCHHPDVAVSGEQIIVAYTWHMQSILYSYFDGKEWHKGLHFTTFHPRFIESLEHSPSLWSDTDGVVHLSFVSLTRRLVYDSIWLGEGFSDPQPFEGLFHPTIYGEEVRVPAERMSVDRKTGAALLSSTLLPERHGVYQRNEPSYSFRRGETLLALDCAEFIELKNLEAVPESMKNSPDHPVIEPTGRTEDFDGGRTLNGGTVLKDGGVYRMWYAALALETPSELNWYDYVYVGYAESDDGIAWKRVATGCQAEYQGKPQPNMILGVDHNACIFIDPSDEPSRRYKAVKFETRAQRYDRTHATDELGYLGLPRRGWLATSPDGFRWEREEISVDFPGPEAYGFTPQKALYDAHEPDPEKRYKAIGFTSMVGRRRGANMAYSADGIHWRAAERAPSLDPYAAVTPIRPAGPYAQIHDAGMDRYGPYLFAFYGHQFDGETADTRLAFTRDGERFRYVFPENPLIALGEPGTWNSGYHMPVDLIIEEDEFVLYYGSSVNSVKQVRGVPPWHVCGGRAAIRRDGFVAIKPKEDSRSTGFQTRPLNIIGDGDIRIEINAALGNDSQLHLQLTDPERPAIPLPGYAFEECLPIRGDSVRHTLSWNNRTAVPNSIRRFGIACRLTGSTADRIYGIRFV